MWNKKLIESTIKNPKNAMKAYADFNKISSKSDFVFYFSVNTLTLKLKKLITDGVINEKDLFSSKEQLANLFSDMVKVNLSDKKRLTTSEIEDRFDLVEMNCLSSDFEINKNKNPEDLHEEIKNYLLQKIVKENDLIELDISEEKQYWAMNKLSFEQKYKIIELINSLLKHKKEMTDVVIELYKKNLEIWISRNIEDFTFKNNEIFLLDFSTDIDDILKSKELFNIKKYVLKSRSMNVNGERIEFQPEEKDNSAPDVFINNSYYGKITHYVGKNTFFCNSYLEAVSLGNKKMDSLRELIIKTKEVHF